MKLIGRGGMGEVWEGTLAGEHGFARRVAIKRMLRQEAPGWENRFMDEARIASRLHHANIVSVLDFGMDEGAYFQVLELIDGIDARHMYEKAMQRGTPLPPELCLHICIEVAHGLASAHSARDDAGRPLHIVHRDVSLENVLVSWEGDVKLSDFGVAKARDRASLTTGGVVGKPAYMAPEQATGGDVDGRTDVFALGCALHALFTGSTPLAGEDRLANLLIGKPLPIDPGIPDDVAAVIAKATSRSKDERFKSAEAMAAEMARLRHARMSQDPRAALRDFLAPLKPKPKRAVGALDALLAPQEVPEDAPAAGSTDTALSPAPPAGRRVLPYAALAAATLFSGAVAYWWMASTSTPVDAPVVAAVAEPRPAPIEAPAVPPPSPPPPEPPLVAAPVKPKQPVPKPVAPAPKAEGSGVLMIGGAAAQRAEILVDGASMGFAPKRLELGVGAHEIVLVTPDGRRLGPHKVDISVRHTDLDPARWLVAE